MMPSLQLVSRPAARFPGYACTLGPTEVLVGGRRLPLPSGRGRAVLALLALHAGEPISADRLIDELWGEDPPPTARTAVQGLVSRLRRVLEPDKAPARLQ